MTLPENIDTTYPDDAGDASVKTHQQHHDEIHAKLNGIEAGADVTDASNVDAAGAVMNSDTSTAAMSFVIDEDNMASDSATKVPTQQSVKAYVDANAGGGMTVISEQVLASTATSISFSSIPGTFRHLLIELVGRGTDPLTGQPLIIQFNGDTTANYDYERSYGNATTPGASAGAGTASPVAGFLPAAGAVAAKPGMSTIRIPNYAGTAFHKVATSSGGSFQETTTTTFLTERSTVLWRSTAAITQITLTMASGSFAAGTVVTLYGLATA